MQITIPNDDIRAAVRDELNAFFSTFQFQPKPDADEIGKGAGFAAKITGKAVSTIYDLCHKRLIPHSKQGKDLYFSRAELIKWMTADGKRRTVSEIQNQANPV